MLIDPKKLVFETRADIIDYVSRGFVPHRKYFNAVMSKVANPDASFTIPDKITKEVVIPEGIIPDEEKEMFDRVMRRIYDNRARNRDVALSCGMFALLLWRILRRR